MKRSIRVIGAGVSGLPCGLLLQESGFQVCIVAAEPPVETTSAAAAGVWMPFHAGNNPRTGMWTKSTYDYCRTMVSEPESGIFFIEHQSYFLSSALQVEKEIQEADDFRFLNTG